MTTHAIISQRDDELSQEMKEFFKSKNNKKCFEIVSKKADKKYGNPPRLEHMIRPPVYEWHSVNKFTNIKTAKEFTLSSSISSLSTLDSSTNHDDDSTILVSPPRIDSIEDHGLEESTSKTFKAKGLTFSLLAITFSVDFSKEFITTWCLMFFS